MSNDINIENVEYTIEINEQPSFIIKLNEQGPQGARGEDGATGPTGNGINNISKTSTSGIVDTYTILYTDGNTSTFTITNGNSIDTIEKTDTVGLVDTYTITMVDGSTHTFEVTNGSSISNISKTSTVGLVDTYTITLTNGDTSTFTVTNGNGISTISKTATDGLTDTYTITFTNGNTTTFDINNGKSITSITGPVSVGLVDTYTINFNDSTSTTFTVTNGEKGDTGDTGATGNGISNIAKTSTSGLEDTYTITYTNGTTTTFKVINGNGISSIEKLSSTGLTDNFRINFTNGTYFDYSLDNAKSIVSIAKTFTSGLVDTYTITYNDNTTSTFLVTNGKGVSGVTLLSWEGLDKTYRMSFNDGTYFDYVVTNGTGQVDWGGISGILSQQADLQDTLVQSNGLTTGSVSTYNVMLDELIERAHSTFDLSKFTVVGSPNITDDGIASGFSSTNLIKIPYQYNDEVVNYVEKIKFTTGSDITTRQAIRYIQENVFKGIGIVVQNGTLSCRIGNNSNWKMVIFSGITANTTYFVRFSQTSSSTTFTLYAGNGTLIDEQQTDAYYPLLYSPIQLGNSAIWKNKAPFLGSIDLKQFSITVDGVPVFSGNKTGIDTIKPDDYTVVGSPTISDDGLVISADNTNYITIPNINLGSNWSFTTQLIWSNATRTNSSFLLYINQTDVGTIQLMQQTSKAVTANIYNIFSSAKYLTFVSDAEAGTFNDGDIITVNIWVKDNTMYYSSYRNGIELHSGNIAGMSYNYTTTTAIYIGKGSNSATTHKIDLNTLKFITNGSLVYQPCLKIPYTESKTGSKIANSIYRDRVNNMAEQFGYANYYTLDEDNGNFTLPQVELHGLIGDKTLRDSYYNGVTYWELFSNRRLEQGGTCVSGVEYTLPRPFADANYVLTIPYSSKTETSFIPSATGDFIAKGRGLL